MNWLDILAVAAPCAVAVGITWMVVRRLIGRRGARGDEKPPLPCPECGYDLRATLFFCPECGTELLWGQVPGEQRDYDVQTQRRERREFRNRVGSR